MGGVFSLGTPVLEAAAEDAMRGGPGRDTFGAELVNESGVARGANGGRPAVAESLALLAFWSNSFSASLCCDKMLVPAVFWCKIDLSWVAVAIFVEGDLVTKC